MDGLKILNKNIPRNAGSPKAYGEITLAENISNGFFVVNRKWTVTYWNKGAETLLGVPAGQIIGKNIWMVFAGIIPVNFYAVYQDAFRHNLPVHFQEYWAEVGNWFDVIIYHYNDQLSVSFKNCTRKVQAVTNDLEYQARTLNQLYRLVTEVTNDCLWEMNLITKEIFWIDGGHKRVFGYPIENALVSHEFWEGCIHPEDKARVIAGLAKKKKLQEGHIWEEEYRYRRANGEYAYVHDRGFIIFNGQVAIRMIGATQDITARKQVEAELLETEQKLSMVMKETVNAVIITDADEKITWVNKAFSRITEYQPEEVLGKKPGHFLQGKDTDPATKKYLREKIRNNLPFDCQIINYTKTGRKYWMHVQGQSIVNELGQCKQLFAIQTDITEKILLEEKLLLERDSKLKEITIAVLAAHEHERADIGRELHDNLNQILGAAKLYIEIAKTDAENRNLYLDKASGYIVNIIEEIRGISKTLSVPGMLMGLVESIKILLDDFVLIHPLKIEFLHHGIKEDQIDEKLQLNIFRMVQEQLNNILKHSAAKQLKIVLKKNRQKITLEISDNGAGCNPEDLHNGVGMMNIRSRAELYHGKVIIRTNPGEGFDLNVTLPLLPKESAWESSKNHSNPDLPSHQIKAE